jgi:hypothetical protein
MMPNREVPEAVSVRVLTPSREIAEQAAPLVAAELYVGRVFGKVLHMEWGQPTDTFPHPGWDCAVEVRR